MWELWQIVNFMLAILFLIQSTFCACQLSKIWTYGHRKASYLSYFLLMSLAETVMRFAFFISYGWAWAPYLPPVGWTILYWTPLHLQFAMFSLIVLFFAKVVHKDEWEQRCKYFLTGWVSLNLILLLGLAGWILPSTKHHYNEKSIHDPNVARATVAAILFFILSILLLKYGLKLARMISESRVQLLATEMTGLQIRLLTILLSTLFTIRSFFNLLAATTGKFGLLIAMESKKEAVMLFVFVVAWELVPIFAVTFIFRHIPNPNQRRCGVRTSDRGPLIPTSISIPNYTPGLFQNPNHYDNAGDFDDSRMLPSIDSNRFAVPSPRQSFRYAGGGLGSHARVPSPNEGILTKPTRGHRFNSDSEVPITTDSNAELQTE
eukprot:CFRG2822T1